MSYSFALFRYAQDCVAYHLYMSHSFPSWIRDSVVGAPCIIRICLLVRWFSCQFSFSSVCFSLASTMLLIHFGQIVVFLSGVAHLFLLRSVRILIYCKWQRSIVAVLPLPQCPGREMPFFLIIPHAPLALLRRSCTSWLAFVLSGIFLPK